MKSTKHFTHTVEKHKNKTVHKIHWHNKPMDLRLYEKLLKWIKVKDDYAPIDDAKLHILREVLKELNTIFETDATLDQVIALRNIAIKEKIIKNYPRMNRSIDSITEQYISGISILKLSKKYDFPPLNLLRGIFIRRGLNASAIYNIFANRAEPNKLLKGRDLKQYKIAEANDAESTFNQQKIAKIALDNENRLTEFFKSLNIKLLSQDDLVKKQIQKYGRPVITPDILFIDEVYINDARVYWIDYKDYIGTPIRFLLTSNTNQATRYNTKWGPGAMCFRYSYVSSLLIPGAQLLDARSLPLRLK